MKNRIILAAGLLLATASFATAQQRTLQLSNVFGQPDSGYVTIPHAPELEPNLITIEAWITPQGFGQGVTGTIGTMVVGKVAQGVNPLGGSAVASWWLGWRPLDGFATAGFSRVLASPGVAGSNVFISSNRSIGIGERAHVAFTFDGHRVRMYVNGTETAGFLTSIPGEVITGYAQDPVLIGAGNICCGLNMRFDGIVDEVRIWDHPRTAFEIARDRDCRLTGIEPGLVGYWNFEGENFVDGSVNANHGTAVGSAWSFQPQQPRATYCRVVRRPHGSPILIPGLWTLIRL